MPAISTSFGIVSGLDPYKANRILDHGNSVFVNGQGDNGRVTWNGGAGVATNLQYTSADGTVCDLYKSVKNGRVKVEDIYNGDPVFMDGCPDLTQCGAGIYQLNRDNRIFIMTEDMEHVNTHLAGAVRFHLVFDPEEGGTVLGVSNDPDDEVASGVTCVSASVAVRKALEWAEWIAKCEKRGMDESCEYHVAIADTSGTVPYWQDRRHSDDDLKTEFNSPRGRVIAEEAIGDDGMSERGSISVKGATLITKLPAIDEDDANQTATSIIEHECVNHSAYSS